MKIYDLDKNEYSNRNKAIALGNFDGFHRAHREIISKMTDNSGTLKSSILLFKDHTFTDLNKTISVLSNLADKLKIAEELSIDEAYIISFDEIKDKSPREFLDLLTKTLGVRSIYVGYDYRFGTGGSGDIKYLKNYCNKNNIDLVVVDQIKDNDQVLSSTYIRQLISENRLEEAEYLLGSEYFVSGKVVGGKGLGSKMGFATANVDLDEDYVLPKPGVYYAQVRIGDEIYNSATSLGVNLTFDYETEQKIEAHLLEFEGDLYGQTIEIRFVTRLREMIKFDNIDQLTKQVLSDIREVKKLGKSYGYTKN